jgi:hypothetical protein
MLLDVLVYLPRIQSKHCLFHLKKEMQVSFQYKKINEFLKKRYGCFITHNPHHTSDGFSAHHQHPN